jgi:CubicO group peptidase (beta-lactamase class C family)
MTAAFVSVVCVATTVAQDAAIQPQVDKIFSRWTKETPGCAVGADVKGQPVVRAAYGMADLEHDVPVTIETIFEAASVSKQFSAAAVLLLARDGKVSLDDRVRQYIPELPESAAAITIRQMLHHTSGLRDWGYLTAIAGWPRGTRLHTDAQILDVLSRQRALNFTPGTQWSYTTSGYTLAAILVARASGMSLADFTRTRIFEPLGMRDTSWRNDQGRIVKRRAVGYAERQKAYVTEMAFENVYGHGGMLTTVGDLLKWNENLARPKKVGDAAFVADLERRAIFNDGRTHEYALGLYVDTFRGVREVDHSGGGLGYSSYLTRYPDQQLSVAVLCNNSSANPTSYGKAVAELFLTGLRPSPPPSPSHTLTAEEAQTVAGLYRSTHPAGAATIVSDENGLRVQNVARLIPLSATRFATSDGFTYEFAAGGRLRTTDEFGTVITYDRVEPFKPSVEQLNAYTGTYSSDEVETALTIELQGQRLALRRRSDPPMFLTPVYADAFSFANIWVIFRRDSSQRVVGFSLCGERLWNLPFSR